MSKTSKGRPVFGRLYPRMNRALERAGLAVHRTELLAGLSGQVIEIGAGDGSSFAHYPPGVRRVWAVEPEPHLRGLAQRSAAGAPVPVEVAADSAEDLSAPDGRYDFAVASLVLCSVSDQRAALKEIHRVLRPGGEFRFFEHVRAESRGLRRAQRVLDATCGPLMCGGCHSGRDTTAAVEAAGFRIKRLDRFRFPDTRVPMATSSHVLGVAVVPA